jgi:protein-tyrosine kinase
MSELTPRAVRPSLLERAAAVYDLGADMRVAPPVVAEPAVGAAPIIDLPFARPQPVIPPAPPSRTDGVAAIDRDLLAARGMLVPGAAIGVLTEEFRLVKRQLLTTARTVRATDADLSRTILVCSARPNDGKTYCAVNLAISLAAERDVEVLLIDADFAKPDVMARLGLSEGPGLLDALADPAIEIERCVVRTDIAHLSLLPCGTRTNADTELVASARTGELVAQLLAADPTRILIFDSPPVLAASPAGVLASHVGQVMLVVRADRTSDGDLREAITLLDACEHIQLLLNAVAFAPGGRRFGSYYGYAQQEDAI